MPDEDAIPTVCTQMPYRVSIIIRNYNYSTYVSDAIDSALAQTYTNVQVIVVDDGSTDASRVVIHHYAPQCEIVLQENGGEGAAVNAGVAAANGDIIIILDSDDVLAPSAAAVLAALWRPDLSRVHYPMWVMNHGGMVSEELKPRHMIEPLELGAYLHRFGEVPSGALSCNAYAASALRRILPMDPVRWRSASDGYLNALTMAQGSFLSLRTPLGAWRRHATNWTLRNSTKIGSTGFAVVAHTQLHADVRKFVGEDKWAEMNAKLPVYHWLHRLFSRRLNPDHPFEDDRLLDLAGHCVSAIAVRPNTSFLRAAMLYAGVATGVLLPRAFLRTILAPSVRLARRDSRSVRIRPREEKHWRQAFSEIK